MYLNGFLLWHCIQAIIIGQFSGMFECVEGVLLRDVTDLFLLGDFNIQKVKNQFIICYKKNTRLRTTHLTLFQGKDKFENVSSTVWLRNL